MNFKTSLMSLVLICFGFLSDAWLGTTLAATLVLIGATLGSANVLYFGYRFSKIRFTVATKREKRVDELVAVMFRLNGLGENFRVKMYSQPSPLDSRFKYRTYVGDAILGDQRRGLVIDFDESLENLAGFICEKPLALVSDQVYKSFIEAEKSWGIGRIFADCFTDEISGVKTKLYWLKEPGEHP